MGEEQGVELLQRRMEGADLSPAPLPRTSPSTISTSPTKLPRSAPLLLLKEDRKLLKGEGTIGDHLEKIGQLENISDDMTLLGSLMSQRL